MSQVSSGTSNGASTRIRAVLFDLDGTLLEVDSDAFFPDYFKALTGWVSPYIDPSEFAPRLMRSTNAMIRSRDPKLTNQEVFMADFFSDLDAPKDKLLPVFDAFYREVFPRFRVHSKPVPGAREVVEATLGGGRKVAVATSPLFPKAAIVERLRWAGLDDLPFALVTSYEEMHFCKPHPEYYGEIAERLGCPPRECLMVGNDVEEDLVAQDVGMLTFLAEPRIIHRGERPCAPDFRGVLTDVPAVLDGRPPAGGPGGGAARAG